MKKAPAHRRKGRRFCWTKPNLTPRRAGKIPLRKAPAVYGTVLIQLTVYYSMRDRLCQAQARPHNQNFRVLSLTPGPIVEDMTTERR